MSNESDLQNELFRSEFTMFAIKAFEILNPVRKLNITPAFMGISHVPGEVAAGRLSRVLITVPPRSGKSYLASSAFPAYLLGCDPSMRIIAASYSNELAAKFARDCRSIMGHERYRILFPDTTIQGKNTAKAADLATQLDTAKADAKPKLDVLAATKDVAKAAEKRKTDTAKAANEAKLALEPVSIYISRATQRLYVRRNTHKPAPDGGSEVFDRTIEVPVTIRDPDKRIGTHVFIAMARNDASLRWSAVTIDDADNAKAALDRITIPPEVLDRIAPTALPQSSIVISDEPLSRETNYRTEFVAVLSNQPQGGFVTRKPTADIGFANRGDDFFGFMFQRNPDRDSRLRSDRYYRQGQPRWW